MARSDDQEPIEALCARLRPTSDATTVQVRDGKGQRRREDLGGADAHDRASGDELARRVYGVKLKAIAHLRVFGGYKRVGKWRSFRAGNPAPMVGWVIPLQPRRYLRFLVQKYRDGAWRYRESARLRIPRVGTLEAVFYVARPGKFRPRTEFRAFDHVSVVSPWRYVRMTR